MNELYNVAQQVYAESLGLFTLTTSIASLRLSFSFSVIANYATSRRQWHRNLDIRSHDVSNWYLVRLIFLTSILCLSIHIFFYLLGLLNLYDYLTQAKHVLDIHIQQYINKDLAQYKQRIFAWSYVIFVLVLTEFLIYAIYSWRENRFDDNGPTTTLVPEIVHIYSIGTTMELNPRETWIKFYLENSEADRPQVAALDKWSEWSALITSYKRKYAKEYAVTR